MIPEGWELRTLQDSGIAVIDGDRGKAYPSSDDFLDEGYCLFLSAKNVTKAGFVFDECQFITAAKHKQLRKGSVQPGDLVLTTRGTVGNVGYLRDLNGFGAVRINSGMVVVRNSQKLIETDFLHALFRSPVIEKQIERMNFGSAQPQLTVKIINSLKLPIPPEGERQRITGAVETWTRAIETVEALIANAHAQKRALMQQLLPQGTTPPQKRLPGFSGTWRKLHIGDVAKEVSERAGDEASYPVLSCSKYDGMVESLNYFKKKVYSEDTSNYKVMRRGTFGFPSNHVEEGSIGYQDLFDAGIVSPIYCVFVTSNEVDDGFLYKLLKTDRYRQIFAAATNASVDRRGSLRWKEFSRITLPLPSLEEQRAINKAVDAVAITEIAYEAQLNALRQEKAALMQQLLTGKRRVKLLESLTPERETL